MSTEAGPSAAPGQERGGMSMVRIELGAWLGCQMCTKPVKKHHERVQAEKEEAAMTRLKLVLPKFSRKVLALALHDCQLDADRALICLRQFQADKFEELEALHKRRAREKSHADSQREPADSASGSSSESDGDDSRDERRHRKKHKKHKRSRDSSKRTKHKKSRHKESKRRRRSSPERGREEFGSYGIIRESDYALRKPEFATWASEVKDIDIEGLPRGDERELFLMFMEDYNTCSLPHKKYYDLDLYNRKKAARDAKRNPEPVTTAQATDLQDDERLRKAELAEQRRRELDQSAHDAYQRMMLSGSHLQQLKEREMMRLQAQAAYKTGDMSKAQKLMNKLNPNEDEEQNPDQGYGQ